jgi:hypothetical protein
LPEQERLKERDFFLDARVKAAVACLGADEVAVIKASQGYSRTTAWGHQLMGLANPTMLGTARLLDKQVIRVIGEFDSGEVCYQYTDLGWVVRNAVLTGLQIFKGTRADEPSGNKKSAPPAESKS